MPGRQDPRDRLDRQSPDRRVLFLVAGLTEPVERLVGVTGGIGREPEVVLRQHPQPGRLRGTQEFAAGTIVLTGTVVSDTRVVMQERRIQTGLAGLPVAQQGRPVEVVTEQPVAVGERLLGGHRRSRARSQQAPQRSGQRYGAGRRSEPVRTVRRENGPGS